MVRRISGKPVIKPHFLSDGTTVGCRLTVRLKRLDLKSGVIVFSCSLWDRQVVSRLAELCAKLVSLPQVILDARRKCELLNEKYLGDRRGVLPIGHDPLHTSSFIAAMHAATHEESRLRDELTSARIELAAIEERMAEAHSVREVLNGSIPLEGSEDGREYALGQGAVWFCKRALESQQWQVLIAKQLERETAELAIALGNDTASPGRERISPEVRRAVWIRDGGCCAKCRSRESLEYDHIVPVSRGGGNTERNIELLCEACNRSKSDRVE